MNWIELITLVTSLWAKELPTLYTVIIRVASVNVQYTYSRWIQWKTNCCISTIPQKCSFGSVQRAHRPYWTRSKPCTTSNYLLYNDCDKTTTCLHGTDFNVKATKLTSALYLETIALTLVVLALAIRHLWFVNKCLWQPVLTLPPFWCMSCVLFIPIGSFLSMSTQNITQFISAFST